MSPIQRLLPHRKISFSTKVLVPVISMMVLLLVSAVVPFFRSIKWRTRPLEAA